MPDGNEKITCRRKTGVERQAEILAVARELIFHEGFGNFTIRTIAHRIGISEAAIYRHFINKEELMLALLDSLFNPWRQAINNLLIRKISPAEKMMQLVELHLFHLIDKQMNPMLFFSEAIHPDNSRLLQELRNNVKFLQDAIASIIDSGKKTGKINSDYATSAAVACALGILQTSVIKWTLSRSAEGLKKEAMSNMKFFTATICNERP